MVSSLIARIPIKWPSAVRAMFKSYETVSNSQEARGGRLLCALPLAFAQWIAPGAARRTS